MVTLTPKIVLDSKPFEFDLVKCTMSAEASDCRFASTQRIWENSTDRGIYIRSHKTGDTVPFVLYDTQKDGDEVYAWKFKSADPELDMRVIIFND